MSQADPAQVEAAFDTALPWGTFAPTGMAAAVLSICHRLTGTVPALYSLNKLIRGTLKSAAPRVFDVEVLGLKLRLLSRGNYCETTALFAPQFYDMEELEWIAHQLQGKGVTSDRTFMDIGGNVGLYSLSASVRCPEARVITVEPDPILAARMQFNAATNGLQVEHQAFALSDYNGDGALMRSEHQSGANQLSVDGADGVPVQVRTLLSLCDELGIDTIDVMKIDIEGHEKPVLDHWFASAPRTRWPGSIVIEQTHDHTGVVETLKSKHGYAVEAVTKRNVMLVLEHPK